MLQSLKTENDTLISMIEALVDFGRRNNGRLPATAADWENSDPLVYLEFGADQLAALFDRAHRAAFNLIRQPRRSRAAYHPEHDAAVYVSHGHGAALRIALLAYGCGVFSALLLAAALHI
jgi:hypothetical protein